MASPKVIIGVDEAGRGAIAGPLVVAAAAFPADAHHLHGMYVTTHGTLHLKVGDSKQFSSAGQRAFLARLVEEEALACSVIERSAEEIDSGLLQPVHEAALRTSVARVMERVIAIRPDCRRPEDFLVLLDGEFTIDFPCPYKAIPQGDETEWQIGAASLVAKEKRDRRMMELDSKYPQYGFCQHHGYPTKAHKAKLAEHGDSPAHRRTCRPVRAIRPRTEFIE